MVIWDYEGIQYIWLRNSLSSFATLKLCQHILVWEHWFRVWFCSVAICAVDYPNTHFPFLIHNCRSSCCNQCSRPLFSYISSLLNDNNLMNESSNIIPSLLYVDLVSACAKGRTSITTLANIISHLLINFSDNLVPGVSQLFLRDCLLWPCNAKSFSFVWFRNSTQGGCYLVDPR